MTAEARESPPVSQPQPDLPSDGSVGEGPPLDQGREPAGAKPDLPAAGTRLEGQIVDYDHGHAILQLADGQRGRIDRKEFASQRPSIGTKVPARVKRHDAKTGVLLLTLQGAAPRGKRLNVGDQVKGKVVQVSTAGLGLQIDGNHGFIPIDEIDLKPVENLNAFLGHEVAGEVVRVQRRRREVTVSRKRILEREARRDQRKRLAKLREGQVVEGQVVRRTFHGAFVDLGCGTDGLLHQSKIQRFQETGKSDQSFDPGATLTVMIGRVDSRRGRISLELPRRKRTTLSAALEDYRVGESVTGLVKRIGDEGASVMLEEGVHGVLPREFLGEGEDAVRKGSLVTGVIAAIDPRKGRIELALH